MKMKSKYIIIIMLSFLYVSKLAAQDFHLSQYDAAPMFLNPALVGQFEGKYRVHGQYRTQWGSVSSKPFNTAAICANTV